MSSESEANEEHAVEDVAAMVENEDGDDENDSVEKRLNNHLLHRPQKSALVNMNILKAFDADPGLQRVMNKLLKQRLQALLTRKMLNRKSIQALIRAGVLKQDPSGEKDRKDMFQRMSDHDLTEFLSRRPSLDELVEANMVEDVMAWTLKAADGVLPRPRNCHTIATIDKQLFLVGGFGTGSTSIDLLIMNVDTGLWSRPLVGGVVPCERYSHTLVTVGSHLLVFGGFSVNGNWVNDLHALDTEYKQEFVPALSAYGANKAQQSPMLLWYQPETTGDVPVARAAHAATVINQKMFVFGGNNQTRMFNDLHILDTQTMKWTQPVTQGVKPSPRAGHTMTAVGNTLIVFGGSNGQRPLNDLFFLDTKTMVWSRPKIRGTPPSPRAGHSTCAIRGDQLLVFAGGYHQKILNDLHMFDTISQTWSRPSDSGTVPSPRAGHACCVSKDSVVYIFGGGDVKTRFSQEELLFNDLYVLDTGYFRGQTDEISTLIFPPSHNKYKGKRARPRPQLSLIDENAELDFKQTSDDGSAETSDDAHISLSETRQMTDELAKTSKNVESMIAVVKSDIEEKLSQFRMKEQSYLSILKSFDCERTKLVMDIAKHVASLQNSVRESLDGLQQKYMTQVLRQHVEQVRREAVFEEEESKTLEARSETPPPQLLSASPPQPNPVVPPVVSSLSMSPQPNPNIALATTSMSISPHLPPSTINPAMAKSVSAGSDDILQLPLAMEANVLLTPQSLTPLLPPLHTAMDANVLLTPQSLTPLSTHSGHLGTPEHNATESTLNIPLIVPNGPNMSPGAMPLSANGGESFWALNPYVQQTGFNPYITNFPPYQMGGQHLPQQQQRSRSSSDPSIHNQFLNGVPFQSPQQQRKSKKRRKKRRKRGQHKKAMNNDMNRDNNDMNVNLSAQHNGMDYPMGSHGGRGDIPPNAPIMPLPFSNGNEHHPPNYSALPFIPNP